MIKITCDKGKLSTAMSGNLIEVMSEAGVIFKNLRKAFESVDGGKETFDQLLVSILEDERKEQMKDEDDAV